MSVLIADQTVKYMSSGVHHTYVNVFFIFQKGDLGNCMPLILGLFIFIVVFMQEEFFIFNEGKHET